LVHFVTPALAPASQNGPIECRTERAGIQLDKVESEANHMLGGTSKNIVGLAFLLLSFGEALGQGIGAHRKAPEIKGFTPAAPSVGAVLDIHGFRLETYDHSPGNIKVHYVQGGVHQITSPTASAHEVNNIQTGIEHIEVSVPEGLTQGSCQVIVEVDGLSSDPATIEINEWKPPEITSFHPPFAQPGESIIFEGTGFHASDVIVLIDAQGNKHCLERSHSPMARVFGSKLPPDIPDGEATLWIAKHQIPADQPTIAFKLLVCRGPIPVDIRADFLMQVAPGQWIDLEVTSLKPLEGADRAEVAFKQDQRFIIAPIVDHENPRVRAPAELLPGAVYIQSRTWLDEKVSFWSEPALYHLLSKPAAPSLYFIQIGPPESPSYIHLDDGPDRPKMFTVRPGDSVIINGMFAVASVEKLQVIIEGNGGRWPVAPLVLSDPMSMKFEAPQWIQKGDWQLTVRNSEDDTYTRLPIAMRVE